MAAVILAIGLLGICTPGPAEDQLTFSVDVNVVNVFATVRDRNGHLVTDLNQDDFVLEEDGKRQEIKYFARQSDVPLTLGLLVDTSMSQRRLLRAQRRASAQFFDQVLRSGEDRAFVIQFDFEVELIQELTRSKRDLRGALDDLRPAHQLLRWRAPRPSTSRGGVGTSMYDAVYLASDEILTGLEGRKAIILISDGVDMGSLMSIDAAIEYAQRSDSIVYAIRYYDPYGYYRATRGLFGGGPGRKGARALKRLSRDTGGQAFDVGDDLTLGQIYERIQAELRSQYSLGYTPKPGGTEFREIRLRTRDKKLAVRTRSGYYPKQQQRVAAHFR